MANARDSPTTDKQLATLAQNRATLDRLVIEATYFNPVRKQGALPVIALMPTFFPLSMDLENDAMYTDPYTDSDALADMDSDADADLNAGSDADADSQNDLPDPTVPLPTPKPSPRSIQRIILAIEKGRYATKDTACFFCRCAVNFNWPSCQVRVF